MEEVTARVARQYGEHAYPKPLDDLAEAVAAGKMELTDPSLIAPLIWPEGRPRAEFDVLVAGCGTQQAALMAFNNPTARVLGVDLSETSLAHQRYLRDKHGLANLQLYQGDLREVGQIGRTFDLIISTGVLHHLADPSQGLRALASVLAPGGAMALMVYGALGRVGVYPLQDAFRRLGLNQSKDSIALVRRTLASLPAHHPVQTYLRAAEELQHDTAIVDTFLHPQDRAYTVPQLLAWVTENGLAFQSWVQNQFYYPDALVEPDTRRMIRLLPAREQWPIVESLVATMGNHTFILRHPGEERLIDFSGEDWPHYRPSFKRESGIAELRPDGSCRVGLMGLRFEMTAAETAVVQRIDGRRSIADILSDPVFAHGSPEERLAFGRLCFERLWKIGAAMFEV